MHVAAHHSLRPEGIFVSALGATNGDGPGGIFLMDHESFDVLGKWELEPRTNTWPTISGGTWDLTR